MFWGSVFLSAVWRGSRTPTPHDRSPESSSLSAKTGISLIKLIIIEVFTLIVVTFCNCSILRQRWSMYTFTNSNLEIPLVDRIDFNPQENSRAPICHIHLLLPCLQSPRYSFLESCRMLHCIRHYGTRSQCLSWSWLCFLFSVTDEICGRQNWCPTKFLPNKIMINGITCLDLTWWRSEV